MSSIFEKIYHFLKSENNFLITSHINADGDAFASTLVIAYLLERWQKDYQIIIQDTKVDEKYSFMWGVDRIQTYRPEMKVAFQAAVVLDVPSRKRIGEPANFLPHRSKCIKIDHHPVEEDFSELSLVDDQASSTSQLVYEVINSVNEPLDPDLATLIFAGIMYDTGRFSFSNTRKRDFEIAAQLLEHQVKPSFISNQLFFNNSFDSMKILGYALQHMESHLEGRLAIIYLPFEVMQKNNHAEIEELANYSVAIQNVEVGLFVREVQPNYFKVSFRSKGRINVNTIAKAFDGGGHLHAAGARFTGKFEDLQQKLISEVKKYL
jgi:phosphoesterase RecJ-like protein